MKAARKGGDRRTVELILPNNLKIETQQLIVILVAIAVMASSFFQVGYFLVIGPEFLSTLTPGDYLYSIGVTLPLLTIILPILVFILRRAYSAIREHGEHSWWAKLSQHSTWLFLLVLVPISLGLTILGHEFLAQFLRTIAIIVVIAAVAAQLAAKIAHTGKLELSTILLVTAGFMCFIASFGLAYGWHYAGRPCTILDADGKENHVLYLRSVSQGHLFRSGSNILYINGSNIKTIMCASAYFK